MNPSHCRNWYCVPKTPIKLRTIWYDRQVVAVMTALASVLSVALVLAVAVMTAAVGTAAVAQ